MTKYLLLLFLFQTSGQASEKRPIKVRQIQIQNQRSLTVKILETKLGERDSMKVNLAELQTGLSLIQGFEPKAKALQMQKKKNELNENLSQVEGEIAYLDLNIQKLTEQQILLSRKISSAK